MAQFLHGKKFQSVVDVEVAVEEFFASRNSRNMRACILNTELLLFCMFWPTKLFISNPTLFMGHPQYIFYRVLFCVILRALCSVIS
jgi:hypothetical protein